jgi:hypothetical protein
MTRRALIVGALALVVWATLVYTTGGVNGSWFGVSVSARSVDRPLVIALALLGWATFAFGWRAIDADIERLGAALRPALTPAIAVIAAAVLVLGIVRGIDTAAGADSYGYVSQADLWLRGDLRIEQPFVATIAVPYADWAFAPLGYRPAVGGQHVIVPTYPPGLPMLMAAFKRVAGPLGPYYVVPILGAVMVWLCYLLGRRAGSPLIGAAAAIILASSPVFLFQLLWPMSDIPAAAFWTAGLLCALTPRRYASIAAGLCASVAIAIRPNLAPLAAILFVFLFLTNRGWRAFALAVLPSFCLIALVNAHLYGSPLSSGYGEIGTLYALGNGPINVRRYGGWLLTTQTPVVALALVALAMPPRLINWFLGAFAAGTFLTYVFYSPFDDWWYLRFLLPALPALLVLMMSGCSRLLGRTPRLVQAIVVPCGLILLVSYQVHFFVSRGALLLREGERRYQTVGKYAASSTPPNAVFISMQHSGSLRYYSGRLTMRYDWVPADWLDRAIAILRAQGYRPYIVLDDWEEPVFKQRFAAYSDIGKLAWPAVMEFKDAMPVRLYEPGVTAVPSPPAEAAR